MLVKYRVSPTPLITGSISSYSVLIDEPSRSGGVQFPASHVPTKCETQTSPFLQLKYIVRPSAVKEGSASRITVLMVDPRFIGRACPAKPWALATPELPPKETNGASSRNT